MFLDCCTRCNSKNMIRAVLTDNKELLKKCIAAKKKISSLIPYWSSEVKMTTLEYMCLNNNEEMLEILLHPKVSIP